MAVRELDLSLPEPKNRGHGDDSVGILLVGNYNERVPTKWALDSLGMCISEASEEFGISPDEIYTHGEITKEKDYMALFDIENLRNICRVNALVGRYSPKVKNVALGVA